MADLVHDFLEAKPEWAGLPDAFYAYLKSSGIS